jgi:hypothetical protein
MSVIIDLGTTLTDKQKTHELQELRLKQQCVERIVTKVCRRIQKYDYVPGNVIRVVFRSKYDHWITKEDLNTLLESYNLKATSVVGMIHFDTTELCDEDVPFACCALCWLSCWCLLCPLLAMDTAFGVTKVFMVRVEPLAQS